MTRALPASRHTRLRGGPALRWGVLAPGGIARDWVRALHAHTDQRVHAVASRSLGRAEAFAAEHGVPRAYGAYEGLLADDGVDIVYIAAPHTAHLPLALLAIAAGKHVLVEKPLATSAADARAIAEAARTAGVFAMEAMWSRFLPQTDVIAQLVEGGELGEVLTVTADFGSRFDPASAARVWDPALGGGALLDIGIYPIWFAQFAFGGRGTPVVTARGSLTETGVEAQAAVILDYPDGAQGVLTTSILADGPLTALVAGTTARIEIAHPFIAPGGFRVVAETETGDEIRSWTDETGMRWRDGLCYQAVAVAADIAAGRTESALHPLGAAIRQLEIIEEARRQILER